MDDLTSLSLTEAARAIRTREVSSVEVTTAVLAWIDEVEPRLNSFISLKAEKVLAAAARSDELLAKRGPSGPLHGVPLAHKDMFSRKGEIATGGSIILGERRADVTAHVVERLEAAGALWLGGLNMSEFAANPTGQNEHWGRCRNPWNLERITGGSSSGSAAMVAAHACYASLGSDTGGSIRLPAAMCGVVGLKPTQGRVSTFGAMPRAWSHDCIGTLTRTACDAALLLQLIAGEDPRDPACAGGAVPDYMAALGAGMKGLRIGIPYNYFYDGVEDEVRVLLSASLDVLGGLGARLVRVAMPDLDNAFRLSTVMTECEAATYHADWLATRPGDYSSAVRARIVPGLTIPATRYIEARNARDALRRDMLKTVFDKVDLVHTPVLAGHVPHAVAADDRLSSAMRASVAGFTRATRPVSYLGLPALSVPAGFTPDGLPASFQLFGRPFEEAPLLRVADAYQQATDWHLRMPAELRSPAEQGGRHSSSTPRGQTA